MQTVIGYQVLVEIKEVINVMFKSFCRDKPIKASELVNRMRKELDTMLYEVNESLCTFFDGDDITDITVICTNGEYTELYDVNYDALFDDDNDYPFEPVDNGFAFIWKG